MSPEALPLLMPDIFRGAIFSISSYPGRFFSVVCGHKKILILANDSNIKVLGVRPFALTSSLEELWIAYSTGANRRYIAIHEVVASLGQVRSLALPGFHAFAGCDTTSSFFGKGKKSAFSIWSGQKCQIAAWMGTLFGLYTHWYGSSSACFMEQKVNTMLTMPDLIYFCMEGGISKTFLH